MNRASRVLILLDCSACKVVADCGPAELVGAVTNSAAHAHLVPTNDAQAAELNSWLALTVQMEAQASSAALLKDHFVRINEFLLLKTFVVGESLSLADVCVFDCLMTVGHCFEFPNIARYLRHGKASGRLCCTH
jgi:glutathione S-transferase